MQIAIFQEQETSGTNGAAPTQSTFNQRSLNTTVTNSITGASLSGGLVTLPAGTYHARAVSGIYSGGHQPCIYDFGNSAVLVNGLSASAVGAGQHVDDATQIATVEGEFTLTSQTTVGINDYVMTGGTGTLFGSAVSSGQPEVYSQLTIFVP